MSERSTDGQPMHSPRLVEVDRVEITVLIDNVTDSLSRVPPSVTPEWVALHRAGMQQMAGSCQCCANHGLSLLIRAFVGERCRTMLFDAGPVDFAVEYNGSRLGTTQLRVDSGCDDPAAKELVALLTNAPARLGFSIPSAR